MRNTDLKTPLLEQILLTTYTTDQTGRRIKWYQRPLYRGTYVCLALLACIFMATKNAPPATPTVEQIAFVAQRPAPPSFTPEQIAEQIACSFLCRTVTECRSIFSLDVLYDQGDNICGRIIPSEIGVLTQLTMLRLEGSRRFLRGPIPSEIGLLTRLTGLCFGVNYLTGTIPSEILLLTQLKHLSFSDNQLNGTIPTTIGLLTQLRGLVFWNTALSGTIPSEIGFLTQLTNLWFLDNAFEGTIPREIGLLTQLTELWFSTNSLTGTIPPEMGLMHQLTLLAFSRNKLTGTVPTEMGLMHQLTDLQFSNNALTGTIPSEIGELTLSILTVIKSHVLQVVAGQVVM